MTDSSIGFSDEPAVSDGMRRYTRMQRHRHILDLAQPILAALLCIATLGCGSTTTGNDNGNGNQNENGLNNENDNGESPGPFGLSITGIENTSICEGVTPILTAEVVNATGEISYTWTLESPEEAFADLSNTDQPTTTFSPLDEGTYTIGVTIVDLETQESLTESLVITVLNANNCGPFTPSAKQR